jgi:hypothetical protein
MRSLREINRDERRAKIDFWRGNTPSRGGLMDVVENENSSIVDGLRTNYQQFD